MTDDLSTSVLSNSTFPKTSILRSSADYRRVFQRGKSVSSPHAKLLYFLNDDNVQPRLGLAISKKQIRYAVNRNKVKRICREAFRHRKGQLLSLDIIAMTRTSAVELPPGEFRSHIDKLLDRIIAQYDKVP